MLMLSVNKKRGEIGPIGVGFVARARKEKVPQRAKKPVAGKKMRCKRAIGKKKAARSGLKV